MNFRKLSAAIVLSASVFVNTAAHAAATHVHTPVNAIFGHSKLVSFQLRNDTNATINLMAGTTALSILPGKTAAVKLAPGEKIITQEASLHHSAGDVMLVVSDSLDSAIVAIK